MGGKSKQARVKNNAKPSNSSRSAELLGSTAPTFVGFSAHSDHGFIPFAPGFNDNATESLDQLTLDPQLQLILRKMSKKDPVTKVKALQEFTELLKSYDVETTKNLLPIWPKLYQNLAIDVDHRVREGSQEVMQKFTSKCKKAVAPFLKQLIPVWLASSFDNYAPAASIANTSFGETFGDKISDVCMHCRAEIIENTGRNLTFHTASTLTMSKNCTPEEAEQKYQRVVCCSLKTLSFFLQKTNGLDISNVHQNLKDILGNAKFWSFAKSKVTSVKASWFELFYHLLQTNDLAGIMDDFKTQLILVCFQNLDESEPLIAPHVWGCILLVQSTYNDWFEVVNFKKVILPKLSSLLRNGCNNNTNAICPNLLPFLSKITQDSLKETNLNDFQKQFFDDIFLALTTLDNKSKSDYSAITSAYFECLRYVIQQINITIQSENSVEKIEILKAVAKRLLNENIIDLLTLSLASDGFVVKYIIQHSSLLIAFWADPTKNSKLYTELLEIFWTDSIAFITEKLEKEKDDEIFLNNITELIEKLYSVNSKIEDQRVKFALEVDEFTTELDDDDDNNGFQINAKANVTTNEERNFYSKVKSNKIQIDPLTKKSNTASYIECELKNLVLQLVRLCLTKCTKDLLSKYIIKVHHLTNLFCDADFYERISEEKTITATLSMLLKTLDHLDNEVCDHGIEIVFNALNFLGKEHKFDFIIKNLLKHQKSSIQLATLNRLLSHPLNVEPEVRLMLSQPEAIDLVIKVANEAIYENSKNCFNLLRKCFFQTDSGDIPINSKAVDSILEILSRPLISDNKMEHLMDSCGSFIAQIMPVICSGENSSLPVQREIFLKLFKFSIEHSPDDFISEDTLWEISTCWQDTLSSKDVLTDTKLLQSCKAVVENCLQKENLTFESIDSIAGAITQFVICSTEHITEEENCFEQIDITINEFLRHNEHTLAKINKTQELCSFLEGLQGKVTVDEELHSDCMKHTETIQAYYQVLLNSCILYKLICKPGIGQIHSSYENLDNEDNDQSCPDDANKNGAKPWSDTLYNETLRCIGMASVADAFLDINLQMKPNLETVLVHLSEKVKMLLREADQDFIMHLKELLWNRATEKAEITACRSLLYILYTNHYEQFEENAPILLLEELSEYFVYKNCLNSYVKTLQYLLPKLTSKAITTQMPIMKTSPNQIWIKAAILRCLIQNNFHSDFNEKSDHNIIAQTLQFLSEVSERQHANRDLLLYNVELHKQPFEKIVDTVELMNMLLEVLKNFPYELTIKNWDTIRIGLSSWVLSVSKSIDHIKLPHVSLFITNVFQLFAALQNFIVNEKQKSSTEFLKNIIDEWDNLFARDVNLVLFKSYYKLVDTKELADSISTCYDVILERITPAIELLDYGVIFNFYKSSTKITIENVMNFLLKNLSNNVHCIRISCAHILKKFTQYFVAFDIEIYENKCESININEISGDWHFLSRFEDYIGRYEIIIRKYLDEFNFKLTDLADMKPIDRNEALSYLLLWDCIVYVCSNSPITLRSLYTNWLHEKRYEENLLQFLFRAMPTEILKNHDSKLMTTDVFKGLIWNQIKDQNLVVEKYACHMYTEVLRKLPAVVRKWWNSCQSRQKTFIDKLTTNFVSPIICSEELKGIASKKEKHENMQVTVHTSTREVLAVYSIDEARMELVITLAVNYPLGSVKVESGKQIGGRLSSQNIRMQLTIFLTHQNGSIFDGLTLWKNNLDKKFEGVEECYVCYTVIHQDTCQLPKLTCKTCKKKFHGPCLYKWFTTSSKSTCPICRNVF